MEPVTAALLAGGGAAGLSALMGGSKSDTKLEDKLTKQQKYMMNILGQAGLSRLGTWERDPVTNKLFFHYNPQAPPEYSLPRVAGLTNMQQSVMQQASDLGNYQSKLANWGGPNYSAMVGNYRPGNLAGALRSVNPQGPQMTTTPYQFNQYALTGMGPGRPAIPQQDINMYRSFYTPAGETSKTNFATGGYMPGDPGQQQYLVGEVGPEMHVAPGGQMNMVGEQGPEVFDPRTGGYIIPNNQLPPMMRMGMGPQMPTGREMPMMGQQGLIPRQEGGYTPNWRPESPTQNTPTPDQQYNEAAQQQQDWTNRNNFQQQWFSNQGLNNQQQQNDFSNLANMFGMNNWQDIVNPNSAQNQQWRQNNPNGWVTMNGQSNAFSNNNYGYGNDAGFTAISLDPSIYGQGQYTPQTMQEWDWMYGNQSGDMQTPNYSVQGGGMPGPNFTPTSPNQQVTGPPAAPQAGANANTTGTPATWDDITGGINWNVGSTPPPTQTGAEWFAQQYPDAYRQMIQNINNPQLAYQYDPNQITQNWQQNVYNPAMGAWEQNWQTNVAPWLQEQFAATGNVLGSENPQYMTRQYGLGAAQQSAQLQQQLAQMQETGRQQGITARQNQINAQNEATRNLLALGQLPSQAQNTAAQTAATYNDIQRNQVYGDIDMAKALGDIDIQRATAAQIWSAVRNSDTQNKYADDKYMLENLVDMAYLDSMKESVLGQKFQNIGTQLSNLGIMNSFGQTEQEAVQNVLNMTYEDWYNALPDNMKTNALSFLMQLLGVDAAENITTVQDNSLDLSGLGSILGAFMGSRGAA